MSKQSSSDPLEFVRNMWSNMGFTLPGMVTPTLDADELEQRITDMKAVEGWLRMNLNMLQASIQGLEVQAATLSTIRAMGDAVTQRPAGAAAPTGEMANPFSAAALWPWMQASSAAPAESAPEPEPEAQKAAPEETPAEDAAPQESDASIAGANAAEAFASAAAAASKAAMWPWQMLNAEAANQTKAAPAKKAPAKKAPAKKRTAAAKAKSGAASTAKRPARAPAKKRVPVKKA